MVQPQGRIAAFCLAAVITGALMAGAGLPAGAQDASPDRQPLAPDGTPFVVELSPEKYNTPYLRQTFGHLLYLAPRQPPVDAGELIGRLLEELATRSNDRAYQQTPTTYCLYREPGAPEFESEAWDRVKERGIDLRPVTLRQRDAALNSGECVLVTVAAAPAEDLPPPFLEVEQRVFETADASVYLRGQVTAAAGIGALYLDKERIAYDRESGRFEQQLTMPAPGREETHVLFAVDQIRQESEAVRIVLRRIDVPPPRIHDYTEVVESEHEVGKVYGYVTARQPLAAVLVDGREAKLDRDSGYFEAVAAMPSAQEPRRVILIEAYDVDKRRGTARVALVRKAPPPQDAVAAPVIFADRTRISSRAETVEVTGRVESELAIAAVRLGDRPAELDGHRFRARVVMPAPFETATLLVTAADVEGNRAEPLRVALERLPWCPADMLAGRDEVRQVQSRLNALGYDAGPADGLFGRQTSGAMDAFWRRQAGGTDCTRGAFLAGLDDAVDDSPPPEEEVAEVPQPPIVTEAGPPAEEEQPQEPRDPTPPDTGLDSTPITAYDDSATITGQAEGDMRGWALTVENRPVRVDADGTYSFPVEGLSCGTNWFRVALQAPDGRIFASLLEVRRTTSLGTWFCHVSTAPPWLWALPVIVLLAAAAVAKLRKPAAPAAAVQIRLEAARDAQFSAEVQPGPRLRLALRFEDDVHTAEVISSDPPARLKEAAG